MQGHRDRAAGSPRATTSILSRHVALGRRRARPLALKWETDGSRRVTRSAIEVLHQAARHRQGLPHRRGRDPRARRRAPRRRARASSCRSTGPSGSGKTTLLSILGLLDSPTQRRATSSRHRHVAKLDAAERAALRNRQHRLHLPGFNLIGDLTVYENVELPLTYRGMSAGERKKRVASRRSSAVRHGAPRARTCRPALGRPAAARRGRARGRRRSADPARRRADREPRLARTATR